METIIHSNGSKWAFQENDSIGDLIKVLKTYKLDLARFAAFGFINFCGSNGYSTREFREHNVRIMGNFLDVSHVFEIEGVYRNLEPLIRAIEDNIKRQVN